MNNFLSLKCDIKTWKYKTTEIKWYEVLLNHCKYSFELLLCFHSNDCDQTTKKDPTQD